MNINKLSQDSSLTGFNLYLDADDDLVHAPKPSPMPVKPEETKPVLMPVTPGEEKMSTDDVNHLDPAGLLSGKGKIIVQVDEDEPTEKEFTFELPIVPGGLDQSDISAEIDLDDDEDKEVEVVDDPWKWTTSNFTKWLKEKMSKIPAHSGKDSAGIERACAYLEALDKEISKAVRMDLDNEIAIDAVEKAREEIHNGIERLEERLEQIKSTKYKRKKNKKAEDSNELLVKEAKHTHVGNIIITVPLLISGIARTCINSAVSAGKDIEEVFTKLAKKFDLSDREQFELMQLLDDMGYYVRRPRGSLRDEEVDTASSENNDWNQNFSA